MIGRSESRREGGRRLNLAGLLEIQLERREERTAVRWEGAADNEEQRRSPNTSFSDQPWRDGLSHPEPSLREEEKKREGNGEGEGEREIWEV
jgi:hypothetical protein